MSADVWLNILVTATTDGRPSPAARPGAREPDPADRFFVKIPGVTAIKALRMRRYDRCDNSGERGEERDAVHQHRAEAAERLWAVRTNSSRGVSGRRR